MIDIVLVNPPLSLKERYGHLSGAGSTMPSIGLCWLAATCRANGFSAAILDSTSLGLDQLATVNRIRSLAPRVIGITATTSAIHSAALLASSAKEALPSAIAIVGGPHVSAIPEETMSVFPQFDIGVLGEGEDTLIDILSSSENTEGIPGTIFRRGVQSAMAAPRPLIENLDTIPYPAWDLLEGFPRGYRPAPFRFRKLPASYLVTSRGCPMRCAFCDRSVFGKSCRFFSVDYVFAMMRTLRDKFGVQEIAFEDDSFTANKTRIVSLCERLIREGLRSSWTCLGRVDVVEQEILRLMHRAGCWQISFGLESGDQGILQAMKKGANLDQARNAVETAARCGIHTKGFFIVGFPGESTASVERSIAFAKSLRLHDITVSQFTPFPGTDIFSSFTEASKDAWNWRTMNLVNSVYVPEGMTSGGLCDSARRFSREFYLRPRIIWSYLLRVVGNPRTLPAIMRGFWAFLKNSVLHKS